MEFKKYNSIENSHRVQHLSNIRSAISSGHCLNDFVVEEKAHGANFTFFYDGRELKTASRSGFLENDGEEFCRSHHIKRGHADRIKTLYQLVGCRPYCEDKKEQEESTSTTTGSAIRVVGELIGGSYKHPSVKAEQSLPRIQKGVEYCPHHEFYAFDLYVLRHSKDKDARWNILVDQTETNQLFERAGLFHAKPLFRGTLDECLAFPNTFTSHISGWLGLPKHPQENWAEGKIIKPVKLATLANGSRIILKDKTEKFSEFQRSKTKEKLPIPTIELSQEGTELAEVLCAHVTPNRLSNVLSKLSDQDSLTTKDGGRICGLLSKDAMEEFQKDYGEAFKNLKPQEKKIIKKGFAGVTMDLVRQTLSNDDNETR